MAEPFSAVMSYHFVFILFCLSSSEACIYPILFLKEINSKEAIVSPLHCLDTMVLNGTCELWQKLREMPNSSARCI